jgi:hypothetical protein
VARVITNVQGLSLVLYGTLLVIIIAFLPNGLIDLFKRIGRRGGGAGGDASGGGNGSDSGSGKGGAR